LKPLAAVRKYHYWSERLVTGIWQDNVARLPRKTNFNIGTSNLAINSQQPDSPNTRAARALAIEELLADHIVTDLDYTGPTTYLMGSSPLVLSSLRKPDATDSGAVMLFADLDSLRGKRIALCLFGSASNVCDLDPTPPLWRCFGWTSSTNNGVHLLLRAAASAERSHTPSDFWHQAAVDERADAEEVCTNALNICIGQGQYHGADERPWHRGFTLGAYGNVEWLAELYFSHHIALKATPDDFDSVHVGAAFWVRSKSARTWRPYTSSRVAQLDAAEHPLAIRPLARLYYARRGQHLVHVRDPGHDYI
jgi:hypothetical protein